jgi:thiosulfate reductase/polysulfide reductase chain A
VESAKRPFIAVRQPACEPLHESKPGWWIAKELAKKLDLGGFFPWETPAEHLEKILEPAGVNAKELLNCGAVSFPGRPYLEDRAPEDRTFDTASGKIELYSQDLADKGADPMPRYTPPVEPPKGFVRLIYGRAPMHSFARTQNNATLNGLMPENEVWLHPAAAKAYLVHGFGQKTKALRRASGRGASDNGLMSRVSVDPLTGGTGMRVNFVRPVKA